MVARQQPPPAPALALAGDMTIYGAAEHYRRLREWLDTQGQPRLDLAKVSEFDSAGLQLLLLAQREAQARGHALELVAVSPAVEDVLRLLRLKRAFGLRDQQPVPARAGEAPA